MIHIRRKMTDKLVASVETDKEVDLIVSSLPKGVYVTEDSTGAILQTLTVKRAGSVVRTNGVI